MVLCAVLTAIGPAAIRCGASEPIAAVNGQVLASWELDRELADRISAGSYHRRVSEERMDELRCEALRSLVLKELKRQWEGANPVPVDPATAQRAWREVRDRFSSDEQYRAALEMKGISEAAFRRAFQRDAVAEAVDTWLVAGLSPPSDEQVEVYFTLHGDEYTTPEARRVVHVLFYVPPSAGQQAWDEAGERAAELIERARSSTAPLVEIAEREIAETPPRFADKVGDLGFVHQGSLLPAIDEAVFSAELGVVSGPIRSIYGYHVLQVVDSRPPHPLTLDQVREAVRERITRQWTERTMDRFETELLDGAAIEVDECGGSF